MFPLGRAISQEIRSPDAAVPEEYTYSFPGAPTEEFNRRRPAAKVVRKYLNRKLLGEMVGCVHCQENPIYVFLFWELRDLSPNFYIYVSVSDL
jgi:hypothetical protein